MDFTYEPVAHNNIRFKTTYVFFITTMWQHLITADELISS